jgi:hypothetical protein
MENNASVITRLKEVNRLVAECLSALENSPVAPEKSVRGRPINAKFSVDFSVPLRAFMKRHAKGLSGPQKFTLLLARLAAGEKSQSIELAAIASEWDKMTSILGGRFNRFYSNQARERDWVATNKVGTYHLRPNWREAIG